VAATILCADDDRHYCQILSRALGQAGYRVELAHDGETALRRIQELDPALVTLDLMLPRLDGFGVLERLRGVEALSETPVMVMSGCTFTDENERRASQFAAAALVKKPVPLDELLALVAKHARRGASKRDAAKAAALGGRFDELPFAAFLHHLHGLRATGVLAVEDGSKKKQVQVRDGIPIAVRSNLVNETLGELLVASGKITPDVLHESLTRVKAGEGLMGRVLVAMQMLDEEDLAVALNRQAEEKLVEVFGWSQGRAKFFPATRIKSNANTLALKKSPANLILAGVRGRMPIAAVDRYLKERADSLVVRGTSPFYQFQEVELGPTEHTILDRLDGATPLGEMARGNEAQRRALFALCVLELVELRATPAETDRPAAPAAAQPRARAETAKNADPAGLRGELAEMAERMRDLDYFGVLGVDAHSDDEEIRAAYAALAKRTHPDRFAASGEAVRDVAEEVFAQISAAYEAIGDEASRIKYLRAESERKKLQQEIDEGQRAVRAEIEFRKGEAALRARRSEVALAHFQAAVECYPDEGEYHACVGWALHLTAPTDPNVMKRAYGHVQKGRKLAPDRAKPYLLLGRLALVEERPDVASKMFSRAIQLDPDCLEALRELRLINMRREKSKSLVRRILRR
jgi:DNA-binding response OmpR family regulator/curved DNA-binding protein CbpA